MKKKSRESISFVEPPGMDYIQAVFGTNVTNDFTRHVHSSYCIGIVQKGARLVSSAGQSILIPENAMFIINPETAHTCKSQDSGGHDYFAICVDRDKMKDISSQISEKTQTNPYIKSVVLFDKDLVLKIKEFFFFLGRADSNLPRESVLTSLLSELIIRYGDSPPPLGHVCSQKGAISRVCEFIKTHLAENLSLEDLARIAFLSPFHFQRLFLKSTGVSPYEYLLRSRIEKARALLLDGRSIAGVASDTGFVDQSHFTRFFKRVVGVAPGRYLELNGKQAPLIQIPEKTD